MTDKRRKMMTVVATLATLALCFGCLFGCAPTFPAQNAKPDPAPTVTTPATTIATVTIVGNRALCASETATLSGILTLREANGTTTVKTDGFTYESGNTAVATVSSDGTVTGVSQGEAEIIATNAQYSASGSVRVQVVSAATVDLTTGAGVNLVGRATSSADGVTLTRPASGLELTVKGSALNASIQSAKAETLRVFVDGEDATVKTTAGSSPVNVKLADLGEGVHRVSIYKTSDALSSLQIKSVSATNGGFYTAPNKAAKTVAVLGGATALGENLGETTGIAPSTVTAPDATKSYAFTAAQKLGYGIDMLGSPDSTVSDLKTSWNTSAPATAPDVVVVQLGGKEVESKSTSSLANDYAALLGNIRTAYSNAQIICAYGGDKYSHAVGDLVKKAVANKNDNKMTVLPLGRIDSSLRGGRYATGATPYSVWHDTAADLLVNAVNGKIASPAYDKNKSDIHVILLGGQSNMEGNSHFRYLIGNDSKFDTYKTGYDNIKMTFGNHESDATKAISFQPVKLGYGGARDNYFHPWDITAEFSTDSNAQSIHSQFTRYGDNNKYINDAFGPEIGFADKLHNSGYDNKVVFIKFAIGGTGFSLSDSTSSTWSAPNGALYKAFTTYVDAALKELAKTYNITLDAMFWMQGETDAANASSVAAYKNHLGNFIESVRMHYAAYNRDFFFYDSLIVWNYNQGQNGINGAKWGLNSVVRHYHIIDNTTLKDGQSLTQATQPVNDIDGAHYDAADEIILGNAYGTMYSNDFPIV